MNKAELKETVQRSLECSTTVAERAIACVLDGIVDGLHRDSSVQLMGFGTFVVKERAARQGRNPTTGEPIDIPASKTIQFRPGKALKNGFK